MKHPMLALLFLASFAGHAATIFDAELSAAFKRVRTIESMAKELEPWLDDEAIKFGKEKFKGKEGEPVKIEIRGDNKLYVSAGKISYVAEFSEPVDYVAYSFLINHKEVAVSDAMSSETLLGNIMSTLPIETPVKESPEEAGFNWPALLVPQAHAQMGMLLGTAIGGLAGYFIAKSMSGDNSCKSLKKWKKHIKKCVKNGLTPEEFTQAQMFLASHTNPNRCKDKRAKLMACLQYSPRSISAPPILPMPSGTAQ